MKRSITNRKNMRKERAERLKVAVLNLLKWKEEQFAAYQYEQGMSYLNAFLLNDEYGISVMERSRTFWNWWKNQWTNADECFVQAAYDIDRFKRLEVYYELHDGRILSGRIYPNRIVLEEFEVKTTTIAE